MDVIEGQNSANVHLADDPTRPDQTSSHSHLIPVDLIPHLTSQHPILKISSTDARSPITTWRNMASINDLATAAIASSDTHQPADGKRGAFIVLEGLDRSGKTTQVKLLEQRFVEEGRKVKVMRFPGMFFSIDDVRLNLPRMAEEAYGLFCMMEMCRSMLRWAY